MRFCETRRARSRFVFIDLLAGKKAAQRYRPAISEYSDFNRASEPAKIGLNHYTSWLEIKSQLREIITVFRPRTILFFLSTPLCPGGAWAWAAARLACVCVLNAQYF